MNRISLFGMTIDCVDLNQAAASLLEWARAPQGSPCRYVVTPNVDHAVLFARDEPLRHAYRDASMVVADGAPLVATARLFGRPLPGRVAGSDLVPRLFELAAGNRHAEGARPLRVFLLGAGPGVAERAAHRIRLKYDGVEVVGVHSPPLGFERNEGANTAAIDHVAAASPDLLVIGLGAPKQELWVQRHADRLQAKVAICAGATIDFLAGEKQRSPLWMQRTGLEWLHRLASEPRRLAKRYLRDALVFPQLVWHEWRGLAR
jgi:N-acetylglucosaminyldiphosphoundecaprenol N-acetyl-beta-D-mannosaminyltransferase